MASKEWKNSQDTIKRLKFDRLLIGVSFVGSLVAASLLVDLAIRSERIETVYLNNVYLDAPTKLTKIRSDEASHRADKWVRSFVRAFIKNMFPDPKLVDKMNVMPKLAWLHAHTGPKGQRRAMSFSLQAEEFVGTYQKSHRIFYPESDSSMTIRQPENDPSILIVRIPGTLVIETEEGKAIRDGVTMNLRISKSVVDGRETSLGDFNIFGLTVDDGSFEVPSEEGVTTLDLFN